MKKIFVTLFLAAVLLPATLIAASPPRIIPVYVELTNINEQDPTPMVVQNFSFTSNLQNVDRWETDSSSVNQNQLPPVGKAFTLYNYKGAQISGDFTGQFTITIGSETAPLVLDGLLFHFTNSQLDPVPSGQGQNCYTTPNTSLVCCFDTSNPTSGPVISLQCLGGDGASLLKNKLND